MRANRAFLRRAVGFMAEQGIEQFLDIGSGVPTAGNVHEVAQRMTPDARVVCVDSEPVAVRHGEALLEDSLLVSIIHPELVRDVERVLEADGLRGMDPELEVTESAVMEDAELLCGRLDELRSLGVALTIDDFGTGYSSLAYLKKLPVDSLKIDRTFVGGIEHDRKNRLIVAATISLAQSLGLSVVAEGVENAGQHECLRELGCDMAQGYYLGRPLPLEAVSAPNV